MQARRNLAFYDFFKQQKFYSNIVLNMFGYLYICIQIYLSSSATP
jgi:hypothetical protein